jgi:hypothetical protein
MCVIFYPVPLKWQQKSQIVLAKLKKLKTNDQHISVRDSERCMAHLS